MVGLSGAGFSNEVLLRMSREKRRKGKMKKKRILLIAAIAVVLLAGWWAYARFMSPTRIATLNFADFMVEKMIRSNDNPWVKVAPVDLDDVEKITKYDMVLVRIHGVSLDQRHLDAIRKAKAKGVAVYSTESDNADINSLQGVEQEYVNTLIENGSVKNYRSLFNYVRAKIDGKKAFNGEYDEPVIVPADYYFHLGDDMFFSTIDQYLEFYKNSGKYKEGAPNIVLLAGNINNQNSNSEHMEAIINSLEKRGLNVFPINSFGSKKLKMIADVKPSLIINRPHGRLLMGGGESGTEMLKHLGVPIFAPVTVSELYEKWLDNRQGMEQGGLTSMSVVMPELDGAIAPFAIAAQFERNGLKLFDAIPGHTEKFCSMVERFTRLQSKPNSEKRVAIYYYKGAGKGALSAAGIEGVQSLYNTLVHLKNSGYNVSGLPSSAKALEDMIQRQGSVLGPYALGAYDTFLKEGKPALVEKSQFEQWAADILPQKLIDDMRAQYGEAPGEYMGVERDDKKYIAVAQITFGNVAILPQPMAAVGENVEQIVHGVEGAPAYPYVASYFWTRNQFKADAMVHFGTHGSLEFIPGKQIALSDYDWTDALVGDMPHFYIYTISNIGEGVIAKRRSYATLIDHMTAPFMRSELYNDLSMLEERVHRLEHMEEGPVKQNLVETVTEMARKQNILSALSIDSTKTLSEADLERIHIHLEEINASKVNDGLYTLGVPYTEEQLNNTARLMSIDPVRYALAEIDIAKGHIPADKLDNLAFISQRYNDKAEAAVSRMLRGEPFENVFKGLVSADDVQTLDKTLAKEKADADRMTAMMSRMMAQMSEPAVKEQKRFLDDNGNLIGADTLGGHRGKRSGGGGHPSWVPRPGYDEKSGDKNTGNDAATKQEQAKAPSAMDRMAQAEPAGMTAIKSEKEMREEQLTNALKQLKTALEGASAHKGNLAASTRLEQKALTDALAGKYIAPSSGGDPIVNPAAVPTGRNFYSINPETTPSEEAWKVGKRLAESLLAAEFAANGKYPEKVSFTLWATDFISSEGATVAQILYLLGVEPMRDGFGYIRSLRLIPAAQLGRPRVDVVVQTSGQLRDIAASRLELINRAIAMAAEAQDADQDNYVRKGLLDAERLLLEKGFSPADARKYAGERIFGGVNGNYGTGIMGLVESGDKWESREQIAKQYINNMGALYSANGGDEWGEMREGVFEAALLNTSVVVQPRSSNTWGPLSLDHVYEFMGGLSAAVEQVTGNDPRAYFNDFRNTSRPKVQELKEAIGVETNSTVFNPKYISHMMNGEASAMEHFAETFRNTFGWNSMKPTAIDQHIWNKYYDVYVKDEYNLGLEKTFTQKNPYALQEMTAVMLEAARKDMWHASAAQLKDVAELHTKLVRENSAGCSGFICNNAKLRDFISSKVDKGTASEYNSSINDARQVRVEEEQADNSVVLKKEEQQQSQQTDQQSPDKKKTTKTVLYMGIAIVALLVVIALKRRKKIA